VTNADLGRAWLAAFNAKDLDALIALFELEKALYEIRYELNNRPDWVSIPVAGIVRMLEEEVPV
jgi:predicted trehalose synthase